MPATLTTTINKIQSVGTDVRVQVYKGSYYCLVGGPTTPEVVAAVSNAGGLDIDIFQSHT